MCDLVQLLSAIAPSLSFSPKVAIFADSDVMDCEHLGDDKFLFDTSALIGHQANLNLLDRPFLLLQKQAVRLTISCNQDSLSELVLDHEYFDTLTDDDKNWILLEKSDLKAPYQNYPSVLVDGELWSYSQFDISRPEFSEILSPLTENLESITATHVSTELQKLEKLIFENISKQSFGGNS